MGLCQGKAAPIEPSSGPTPARASAAATPGAAAPAAAAGKKVELTDDQVNKWIALSKVAYKKRTWSDPHCSPDQVRQNNNKIVEERDKYMHDEASMKPMMDMIAKTFNELLPTGQNSLSWTEMK